MKKPTPVSFAVHLVHPVEPHTEYGINLEMEYKHPTELVQLFQIILQARPDLIPVFSFAIARAVNPAVQNPIIDVKETIEPGHGKTASEN